MCQIQTRIFSASLKHTGEINASGKTIIKIIYITSIELEFEKAVEPQFGKMFIALDQTNAFFSGIFQHANLFDDYL